MMPKTHTLQKKILKQICHDIEILEIRNSTTRMKMMVSLCCCRQIDVEICVYTGFWLILTIMISVVCVLFGIVFMFSQITTTTIMDRRQCRRRNRSTCLSATEVYCLVASRLVTNETHISLCDAPRTCREQR